MANLETGPELTLEIERAHYGLRRALVGRRRRFVRTADGVALLACLNATEWRAGPVLRESMRMTPMVFSLHLRGLLRRRLIEVRVMADDRRFKVVRLTSRGVRLRDAMIGREANLLGALRAEWGTARVELFLVAVRTMLDATISADTEPEPAISARLEGVG